ncbi:PREDICTED: uncharacterized protein LOC104804336 [Tarenaya hassleriana]|uniref:uncharacterized protein LOC104804336 n=1 Tax=Tarenaya hassleriana TaxID=28532 RepID=UPI00053CA294|nr:PREDICTED: uncharacterized protein LOC104804336 [Tarenaya hassleriana]
MEQYHKLMFLMFIVFCIATDRVRGYATVTGTVFCDQCKDGEISLFDYPVSGIKVSVTCSDGDGQVYMTREETTNWLGGYVMRFDGQPDLSNCYAQVSDIDGTLQGSSNCSIAIGPAKKAKLMFSMFGMAMYNVDGLLTQPSQPMSSCPKPETPKPAPQVPVRSPSIPAIPSPQFKLPPLPPLPPMPPMPFVEPSACSHQYWTRPEYKCYWRALSPDTKVAVAFGVIAGRKYGTDITLWEALQGRGEAYKTLLREATTSLLNSYNSFQFPYSPISVITDTNLALVANSQRRVLLTALRFLRANSGSGKVTCRFTPCH